MYSIFFPQQKSLIYISFQILSYFGSSWLILEEQNTFNRKVPGSDLENIILAEVVLYRVLQPQVSWTQQWRYFARRSYSCVHEQCWNWFQMDFSQISQYWVFSVDNLYSKGIDFSFFLLQKYAKEVDLTRT
jgi:hypothetical protein